MQALLVSILLLGLSHTYAQSIGNCQSSPVLPNFEFSKYLGEWFEIERFPYIFEKDLQCVTATYSFLNETAIQVNKLWLQHC